MLIGFTWKDANDTIVACAKHYGDATGNYAAAQNLIFQRCNSHAFFSWNDNIPSADHEVWDALELAFNE